MMVLTMKAYLGLENVGVETRRSELLITELVDNSIGLVLVELPRSEGEEPYSVELIEDKEPGWILAGKEVVVGTGLRLLIKELVDNSAGLVLVELLASEGEEPYSVKLVEGKKLGWILAGKEVIVGTGLRLLIEELVDSSVGLVLVVLLASKGEELYLVKLVKDKELGAREVIIVGTALEPGRLRIVELADDGIGPGLLGLTMIVGAIPLLVLLGLLVTVLNKDPLSKLDALKVLELEPIERGVDVIGPVEETSTNGVKYVPSEL